MALVDMRNMLHHAYDNGYAVGCFAVVDLHMLEAVISAAERCRAPVIIALSEPLANQCKLSLLAPAVEQAAIQAEVPVAIHFDHGSSVASVAQGVRYGCNSVMIDGSRLSLHENVQLTRAVVEMAHSLGLPVEAELGYVPIDDDEGENEPLVYTTVEEARGFVRHTGADFLAVSVGTMHGRSNAKTKLDYQRLRQINEALHLPLVLHGSSGLSDDKFRRLIAHGVAKINYFSALVIKGSEAIKANASKNDKDYLGLHEGIVENIADEIERCMRVWGSAGRAAEVFAQCRSWSSSECLIGYRPKADPLIDTERFLLQGKTMLESIPGVRSAKCAFNDDKDADYSYGWKLSFAHPDALHAFNHHPVYETFVRRYLNQAAETSFIAAYQMGMPVTRFSPAMDQKFMVSSQ